jgi:hypothetical protein
LCAIAIQTCGMALTWIPKEYITYELCVTAIQQCGDAIQFIFKMDFLTKKQIYELCIISVQQHGCGICYIVTFGKEYITYELCLEAVTQNGVALKSIPEEHRTYELYKTAVQNNCWAIRFMFPTTLNDTQTREICNIAIQQNSDIIRYIPKSISI